MDNKFYFHHLPLNVKGTTKLIKIFNASVVSISTNNNKQCIINLDSSGYKNYGTLIPDLKFYYDSLNKLYYICLKPNYTEQYININILGTTNQGYAIMDFDDNFNINDLIELNKQNLDTSLNYEKSPASIQADIITEYKSILQRKQYTIQCSLILLSLRNNNGIGGNALFLLTRTNDSTINDFILKEIYMDSLLSQFNITPTNNGFSFTNSTNYKYSITEIPNIIM